MGGLRGEELWAAWQERLVEMLARDLERYPEYRTATAGIALGAELWLDGLVRMLRFRGTKFEAQGCLDVLRGRRMVHDGGDALLDHMMERSETPETPAQIQERVDEALREFEEGEPLTWDQHEDLMGRRFLDLVGLADRNVADLRAVTEHLLAGDDLERDPELRQALGHEIAKEEQEDARGKWEKVIKSAVETDRGVLSMLAWHDRDPQAAEEMRAKLKRYGLPWPGSTRDSMALDEAEISELKAERAALISAFWLLREALEWQHTHDIGEPPTDLERCPRCNATRHAEAKVRAAIEHRPQPADGHDWTEQA